VTKFCRSKFGEAVPEGGAWGEAEEALAADLTKRVAAYGAHMDAMEVRKSATELRAIWAAGNEYLQAAAPWTTIKEDEAKAAMQIRLALNLAVLYAKLSSPFIPDASAAIATSFGLEAGELIWPEDVTAELSARAPGAAFTVPENLFSKITDEQREGWQEQFAGQR